MSADVKRNSIRIDGETDRCHVVERRDGIESETLQQNLNEHEPARFDSDRKGLPARESVPAFLAAQGEHT